jgi:hypothetical protein
MLMTQRWVHPLGLVDHLFDDWPKLPHILWREQHQKAKGQKFLDFTVQEGVLETLQLFDDRPEESNALAGQCGDRIS